METLIFILSVLLLAFLAASLEMAYQRFMEPNMFLYPWAVFLLWFASRNEVCRHLSRVLGVCRYCNGTWVGIYMYKYFFGFDLPILIMVGATFFFIYMYTAYIAKEIDFIDKVKALHNFPKPAYANTPIRPMLITYVIMAVFYSSIYLWIPMFIHHSNIIAKL